MPRGKRLRARQQFNLVRFSLAMIFVQGFRQFDEAESALTLQRNSTDPSAFIRPAMVTRIHQLEADPEFKLLILSL
jgi:hypothetical protein